MSTNTTLKDVMRELTALEEPKMRDANERGDHLRADNPQRQPAAEVVKKSIQVEARKRHTCVLLERLQEVRLVETVVLNQ